MSSCNVSDEVQLCLVSFLSWQELLCMIVARGMMALDNGKLCCKSLSLYPSSVSEKSCVLSTFILPGMLLDCVKVATR